MAIRIWAYSFFEQQRFSLLAKQFAAFFLSFGQLILSDLVIKSDELRPVLSYILNFFSSLDKMASVLASLCWKYFLTLACDCMVGFPICRLRKWCGSIWDRSGKMDMLASSFFCSIFGLLFQKAVYKLLSVSPQSNKYLPLFCVYIFFLIFCILCIGVNEIKTLIRCKII